MGQIKLELRKLLLLSTAALITGFCTLVPSGTLKAQSPSYDLARDWSLTGVPLKGIPFGPDDAWSVAAVQFKPDSKWESFDRAMHFTISNPWLDLYGIDGWWLGSSPVARKPMAGKNVGSGNIPGTVHGVNYDWPLGSVAVSGWPNSDQSKGERPMTAVIWTAPATMRISITGGIWMAGEYQEFAEHRTHLMLWISRAASGGKSPPEIIIQDVVVPLWTEGYDSAHPQTFAQILGAKASSLNALRVEKGDRIGLGFYGDGKESKPGLSGIDFRVLRLPGA